MDKKGIELAISTLILIVLGVLVLAGLIVYLKGGLMTLDNAKPIADSASGAALKEGCNIACRANDRLTYCCHDFELKEENIRCSDPRLEINCALECSDFNCSP